MSTTYMRGGATQFDMSYLVRYQQRGGHFHCDFFSKKVGSSTWQNGGHLVVGENEWTAFGNLLAGATFVERQDGQ